MASIDQLPFDRFVIDVREPLFFMHIPKTAGTSMRLYLRNQYRAEDVCPATRWQDLLGREGTLKDFRLIQGHFRYNLRGLLPEGTRILTILREPLRRTLSAIRHLRRDPNFHHDHELAKSMTIAEILRHPHLMRSQHNVQARFLCASRPPALVSTDLTRARTTSTMVDAGDAEAPPKLLLAQERLASIAFVGLTEEIDTVLSDMAREMRYHPPTYFPRINEDSDRRDPLEDMSVEDFEILRRLNDVDLPLYEYASRLIQRRGFEQSMRVLVGSGMYKAPLGSFEIAMTDTMPGSGWYAAELEGEIAWRWTGPGRHFSIEMPLRPDKSYRLRMSFGSAGPFGPGDLTAQVNDVPVDCAIEVEDAGYRCELVIAQERLSAEGFCCIRFDTGGSVQISAEDSRQLGVSVRRVTFECIAG